MLQVTFDTEDLIVAVKEPQKQNAANVINYQEFQPTGSIAPCRNNYVICYGVEQIGKVWRNNEKAGGIDFSNLICQPSNTKYKRIIKEAASVVTP